MVSKDTLYSYHYISLAKRRRTSVWSLILLGAFCIQDDVSLSLQEVNDDGDKENSLNS